MLATVFALLGVLIPVAQDRPPERLRLADGDHLPLAFAAPVLAELEVAYHDDAALALAWYQPAPLAGTEARSTGEPKTPLASSTPSRPGARLWLNRQAFGSAGGTVRVGDAPIDLVENLAFALLLARLHEEVERGTEGGRWLRERSASRPGAADDADQTLASSMIALASFGSHLLSLANEIERLDRRRRARGDDGVCGLLRRRVGLFLLWERAFGGDFLTSGFARSREIVEAVDVAGQRWVIERLLGAAWTGDVVADLGRRYC